MRAGAAIIDVTPPVGLAMAGFAARTEPAIGVHDPLTVRAIAVDDTAIVCADVIGLHEDSCRRIRDRARLDSDLIIVAALHNHGGPTSMQGRVGLDLNQGYLELLEDACVRALDRAVDVQRPARLLFGLGADPKVARNRRHANGAIDSHLPVLRIQALDGAWIAVMTAYACHPVVLGADNRLWTADYPHVVRQIIEARHPGAMAMFLTGCAADANTGHSAQASISLAANPERSFVAAERIGGHIAECTLEADARPIVGAVAAATTPVTLDFARRETESNDELTARWRAEITPIDPARRALLQCWIEWAETVARQPLTPWRGRVTALNWGGVTIVALPGEIFAETALDIRARLADPQAMVVGFSDGCPGYIPPLPEYAHGGYEVDEAHRYYGMPASFAPGSAEVLADAAIVAARDAAHQGRDMTYCLREI